MYCVMYVNMKTVSKIFDDLGGNAAVARVLGVGASTASEMKRRESIPVEYWPALVDEARRIGAEGITLESLALTFAEVGARRRSAKLQENAA